MNPVANAKNPALQGQLNYKSIFGNTMNEVGFATDFIEWEVSNSQNNFNETSLCLRAIDMKLQEYKSKFKGATIAIV